MRSQGISKCSYLYPKTELRVHVSAPSLSLFKLIYLRQKSRDNEIGNSSVGTRVVTDNMLNENVVLRH